MLCELYTEYMLCRSVTELHGVQLQDGHSKRSNQKYRIKIPKGKKWIFSYYIRANTTSGTVVYPWFYSQNNTKEKLRLILQDLVVSFF